MLKNNIELDVKTKCTEEGKTQTWVAEEVGTSPAYVSRIVNSREQIVNKTFFAMMDALGYDVRLTYEKRETAEYNPDLRGVNEIWIRKGLPFCLMMSNGNMLLNK